jgi:hypothetical protein
LYPLSDLAMCFILINNIVAIKNLVDNYSDKYLRHNNNDVFYVIITHSFY